MARHTCPNGYDDDDCGDCFSSSDRSESDPLSMTPTWPGDSGDGGARPVMPTGERGCPTSPSALP